MNLNSLSAQSGVGIPAARPCQIEEQGVQLGSALETLHKTALELNQRLMPVTRPEAPATPAPGKEAPREMLVQLADNLRDATDRTQRTTALLCDILQRLELP